MTQTHPINPPEELLEHWHVVGNLGNWQNALTLAYRAGADQELEACIGWLAMNGYGKATSRLHAIRRPKPSLKEQALMALDAAEASDCIHLNGLGDTIRRALEQLPDAL